MRRAARHVRHVLRCVRRGHRWSSRPHGAGGPFEICTRCGKRRPLYH